MNNSTQNSPTEKPSLFQILLRAARGWDLLVGILFYTLGAGVARYQGYDLDWTRFAFGLVAALLLQLSAYYLKAFFDEVDIPVRQRRELLPRQFFLAAALTCLTGGAGVTLLLNLQGGLTPVTYLVLGLALLLATLYATPPLRLVYSAYGDLAQAILLVNLIPALAGLLQTGEIYRILPAVTFPLTAMYLAMSLAHAFPAYAADNMERKNKNLIRRIGWQNGVSLHNILLLIAYLMMGGVSLLGLPWGVFGPAFLTLPLALFQIWQMLRIAGGARVHWRLLVVTASGTLLLTAYLLAYRLWIW
jgi:1,4-dihydroxy-2-naphthoate octaprenyltransferase